MPLPIFNPIDNPPDRCVDHVAVAIQRTRVGYHLGIYYRGIKSKKIILLHLGWHHDLRHDPPDDINLWAKCSLSPQRAPSIAMICDKFWTRWVNTPIPKRRMPYGLSLPNDCISKEDGELLLGADGGGLTCATFVLALFQGAGFPLIDTKSWRSRPQDTPWKESVIKMLKQGVSRGKVEAEHVKAVKEAAEGAFRFTPGEVLAASCTPLACNTMQELEPLGKAAEQRAVFWLHGLHGPLESARGAGPNNQHKQLPSQSSET